MSPYFPVSDPPTTPPTCPPIVSTTTRKKDVIPVFFDEIDDHALKAPSEVQFKVEMLAMYLVTPARNALEKVRAIYRWIAENIRYDTKLDRTYRSSDEILRKGETICGGYARLFYDLCSKVGIPCKKISGFSKTVGYDPEKPSFTDESETDHAWNIVFINGEWTWRSGHANYGNNFEKRFNEFFFLTDPKDFLFSHFPFMDNNLSACRPLQLLTESMSLTTFNSIICPATKGIEYGFECLSHKTQVITVNKGCIVTFRASIVPIEDIICKLIERNTHKEYTHYVLLNRKGKRYSAKVTPPVKGTYELKLYGKSAGSVETTYDMLVSFVVRCQSNIMRVSPYPDKDGVWGARANASKYGFTNDIFRYNVISVKNGETEMRYKMTIPTFVSLKLSHADETKSNLDEYAFAYYERKVLVIKIRCRWAGFYKLSLFAKDCDGQRVITSAADFLIDSKVPNTNVEPFPKYHYTAQEYGCILKSPINGNLQANIQASLTLSSEKLMRLIIEINGKDSVHTKGANGMFDIPFRTPEANSKLAVYGHPNTEGGIFYLLYEF